MREVNIVVPNITTISISGKNKQKVDFKHVELKSEAAKYGGKILRDEELTDGFFMEVLFENPDIKDFWEGKIGLKK